MGPRILSRRSLVVAAAAALVVVVTALALWVRYGPRTVTVTEGKFPEELVYVRSADDIVNGGAMFTASKTSARPIAVIWIHGWGTNFYSPTYVMIGRALAARGYTAIIGNTRMHDLGNVAGYRYGKRIRGGGYWGIASEEVRDLAAWIDFAEQQGFEQVVLVGHSAGWSAVKRYQADQQDPRVVGVVLASGAVGADTQPTDPQQLADATRMVAAGNPGRSRAHPQSGLPLLHQRGDVPRQRERSSGSTRTFSACRHGTPASHASVVRCSPSSAAEAMSGPRPTWS